MLRNRDRFTNFSNTVDKDVDITTTTSVQLTCPIRPEEPIDRSEPSATSLAEPKSDSTVWVWLSPQSSECFPGTLVETHDPDQTGQEVRNE